MIIKKLTITITKMTLITRISLVQTTELLLIDYTKLVVNAAVRAGYFRLRKGAEFIGNN